MKGRFGRWGGSVIPLWHKLKQQTQKMSERKKQSKTNGLIPEPSLRRLPWYLSHVKLLHAQETKMVSSTAIAKAVGVDASLVAKDLSYVSLQGRTRVGYKVEEVIRVLEEFLGFTATHRAYLFGVGSLGGSLLADRGLRQFGLEIVAGFDVAEGIVGQTIGDIPVYHIDELEERMRQEQISIAILTVPIKQAQSFTDRLVQIGFEAIWNFTPVRIQTPEHVVVQNTSMYAHLALIFTRMRMKTAQ